MENVRTKPRHTESAHCRACRPVSHKQVLARRTRRIAEAQAKAVENFMQRKDCLHPKHLQVAKIVPAEEDWGGRVLDGAIVTVCTVCFRVSGEVL